MVKAIQEQQAIIENNQKQIDELKTAIIKLTSNTNHGSANIYPQRR